MNPRSILIAAAALAGTCQLPQEVTAQVKSAERIEMTAANAASQFYCDRTALTPQQRLQIRSLGRTLRDAVEGVRELDDGFEFEFGRDLSTYQALVQYLPLEHACCPFFEFTLRLAPEGGKLYWSLTGTAGVKEFIREELEWLFTGLHTGGSRANPVP